MDSWLCINFDLDHGPKLQSVYPSFWLSPTEMENVAFSALPDSLQFDQGSEVHSFRIRDDKLSSKDEKSSRPRSLDGFTYGFSYFSQQRDASSKRGYRQSAIVILTHLQYPALFCNLASTVGPLYHAHGVLMLETACHNVANWCNPLPGSTLELGFLGSVMHVELPQSMDEQQLTETYSFQQKFDPSLHILASSPVFHPPPIDLFEACISHLWSMWECLVLCEPILVFGRSPAMTSQAIWWLRDILRPLPLAMDIRPYFTIHDKDHSSLVNKLPPKAGLLLGVTNPFFEKSCLHWPHVLSVGKHLRAKSASATFTGPSPGWQTKTHKRYISKDQALLKQLEHACNGSQLTRMEASFTLRRHFCSRTNALLVPLNRYLNSLIPTPAEAGQFSTRLKPFSSTNFFSSLKSNGSPLPFRSANRQKDFYERWLRTPAFGLWLAQQEDAIQKILLENAVAPTGSFP
ncbi:hypothetical protein SERLA73DRAFT_181337 [Serpula lacrymans var. lacrymans S7.3]|uniref:UDENN domain-containing protein n=2 Tax=Serpula lacrymans var. lacrymans TaxID=341189 RepID=F8PXV9_SERL3|nr:uncharacterized protein SERLADRAFT_467431 [Serpula lacrymans var. lacrymans S7.9]EGN98722.1 hypothetical protein SERLA73DRAFT_181337 [Serpula lacrymans var. lacrymans S7.3]EGO24323.1 hypothetical protein SERLADRAFT_467431 [Serpula lacrymans var. lacrymans S7.9]